MGCSKCCTFIIVAVVVLVAVGIGVGVYVYNKNDGSSKGSRAVDTLKFLVLVTRHGNRCPLYELSDDPYPCSNSTLWPYQDELSIVGRTQLYNLGMKMRSLYDGFLDTQFFNDDVYVSSTSSTRVVESGKCLLAGLYPPSGNQVWNKTLLWQPIPIHQDSLDKTQLKDMCQLFETLYSEQQVLFRTNWAQNISYFNNYTNAATNGSLSSSRGVLTTWDTLLCDMVEGFTLPEWTNAIFPDPMYAMMNDMYVKYVSASDVMTRLTIGPFLAVMMDVINSKVNGTLNPDRPFYYWSGHDDTLIALQAAVGLATEDIVGIVTPGSAFIVEVHKNSKHWFVETLYIDGIDSTLKPTLLHLPICNNKTSCDYDTFVQQTAKFTNVTSANYDEVCSSSSA